MRVTLAIPAQMEMLPPRPDESLNLAAPGSLFHHNTERLGGPLPALDYLHIYNAHFNLKARAPSPPMFSLSPSAVDAVTTPPPPPSTLQLRFALALRLSSATSRSKRTYGTYAFTAQHGATELSRRENGALANHRGCIKTFLKKKKKNYSRTATDHRLHLNI